MREEAREPRQSARLSVLLAVAFAAWTVVRRLIPYAWDLGPEAAFVWNMVPVGALGLFAGARLRSRAAYLLPLGVLLVSDLLLAIPLARRGLPAFSWNTPLIYGAVLVYALIGRLLLRHAGLPLRVGGAALLGSVQFFLVTNFGVWLFGPLPDYPRSWAGLLECYA